MSLNQPLNQHVALVTGAARGIGEATAQRLSRDGAAVAVCDIDLALAEQVAAALRGAGGKAQAFACDVAKPDQTEQLVREVTAHFGFVDILVNNAAICPRVSIPDMTEATFDSLMNVNLKSVFFLTRAAAEAMKDRGWGRVVNISSTGGRIGGIYNATVYGATKAGILAMTKSFARYYSPYGILINAVAPGAVDTRMMSLPEGSLQSVKDSSPMKRLAQPTEIANAIAFFCSTDASWVTGATLDVNGGTLML